MKDTTKASPKDKTDNLAVRETLLEVILESTIEGILIVDTEGNTTHANRKFAELWRIPRLLLETRDDEKLLAFVFDQLKDPYGFRAKVKELYGSNADSHDIIELKDGRVFDRISRAAIIDGTNEGRIWRFRDTTELKKAESARRHSEEKYANLFENSHDAIIIHDLEGNILDGNQRMIELFGFSSDELPFLKISQLFAKDTHEESQKAFDRVNIYGSANIEITFCTKTDSTFPAEVTSTMFDPGDQPFIQTIISDKSAPKSQ